MRRTHLMGVGGAGVSALARILAARGDQVSGCDLRRNESVVDLERDGIEVRLGHHPDHLAGVELLVYSGAVKDSNPELAAARGQGLRTLSRAEVLAELIRQSDAVAVAGTHGKTTTTHMLGTILTAAGWDPSVLVGDGRSSRVGKSRLLVAEADESDGSLVHHHPARAILTNMELDHPDHFADLASVHAVFAAFAAAMPAGGLVVACAEEPRFASFRTAARVVTYGIDAGDYRWDRLGFEVGVPGRHNRLNACGAAAMALEMGVEAGVVGRALAEFSGAHRRLEKVGEWRGADLYDDYGHHPTEVAATLAAARELVGPGGRLVLVFQPHRYTRFAAFQEQFPASWAEADDVLVAEIYGAGEENAAGLTSSVYGNLFAPDVEAALRSRIQPGDVVLFMGAGDIGQVARGLAQRG